MAAAKAAARAAAEAVDETAAKAVEEAAAKAVDESAAEAVDEAAVAGFWLNLACCMGILGFWMPIGAKQPTGTCQPGGSLPSAPLWSWNALSMESRVTGGGSTPGKNVQYFEK